MPKSIVPPEASVRPLVNVRSPGPLPGEARGETMTALPTVNDDPILPPPESTLVEPVVISGLLIVIPFMTFRVAPPPSVTLEEPRALLLPATTVLPEPITVAPP